MSQRYNYRAFTKDFIVNNVTLKIADVIGSDEVFTDVKAKLTEMPKNELIERFAETYNWKNKEYTFDSHKIYQYAIDEKLITPHDMAISEDWGIKNVCANLGYEHELLAKDENSYVRNTVLWSSKDPKVLNILWNHSDWGGHAYNPDVTKEDIICIRLYGVDAALQRGDIKLINEVTDKLVKNFDDAGNYKYKTFQEYFEAHPETCVLPENRKAQKVAEAAAPKRDIMMNAQVADKIAGKEINQKK